MSEVKEVHSSLMSQITAVLSSGEFNALPKKKQQELRKLADAVRDEIARNKPHRPKVRRSGNQFLEKALDTAIVGNWLPYATKP